MFNTLTTKLAAIGAFIFTIGIAILAIFKKGENAEKVKEQQRQAKATETAKVMREKVDESIQKLPEAPVQTVGDAAPDSAAGRLSVWTRD